MKSFAEVVKTDQISVCTLNDGPHCRAVQTNEHVNKELMNVTMEMVKVSTDKKIDQGILMMEYQSFFILNFQSYDKFFDSSDPIDLLTDRVMVKHFDNGVQDIVFTFDQPIILTQRIE